jgi:glutamate-ammonia-ligase adenylyltransferase
MSSIFSSFGFKDPHRAARILRAILATGGLSGGAALDIRGREAFRAVSSQIFPHIARSAEPETTLNNFGILAGAAQFPGQFFQELQEPGFRKLILALCESSTRLTRGLARDSLLMELIATNSAILAQPWDGKWPQHSSLAALKSREELRAGIRHALGISAFREFTVEMSRIADEVVASVFEEECKQNKVRRPALALFAVGKYGTRELSLDADLDIIFVGGRESKALSDKLEKVASGIIRRMTDVAGAGKLYDIDARLRPEGRNAPLVVDKRSYAQYLEQRASLWERQSLTRLRFLCGDVDLGTDVAATVAKFVYESPLKRGWTDEIVAMRRKVETRSHVRASEFHDVKLGAGGMVDVEFLAQMIQLHFGRDAAMLRYLPTIDVLARSSGEFLPAEVAMQLTDAYQIYRRIELLMRLAMEERGTVLPQGDKLDVLARHLRIATGAELLNQVRESMKLTRGHFLQTARKLSQLHS